MHLDPKKAGTYFSNQAVSTATRYLFLIPVVSTSLSIVTVSYRAGPRTVCAGVQRRGEGNKKCFGRTIINYQWLSLGTEIRERD